MENKKSFIKGALLGALVMLLVVAIGTNIWKQVEIKSLGDGVAADQAVSEDETDDKLKLLGGLIDQFYLYPDEVDEDELRDGIYTGYVNALDDPYSVYYNEEQTKDLLDSTSGEYSGVGAVLSQNYQTRIVTIGNVYKDSPAEEAGLKSGDILYQVDDREIKDEDLSEIVTWIKGEEGTEVMLHVYRGENLDKVECKAIRRTIEVQTVEHEMMPEQIGYIRITEFDQVTLEQYKSALSDLENQGMTGLVIDLRSNPGGDLDTVAEMLKVISPKGLLVSYKTKEGTIKEYVNEENHQISVPMTVLVNQYSASASEIFAGTVQDYEIGKIVGMTTYGKGVVQQLIDIGDGTCLKLTIAEYFTAKGRSVDGKGVTPDVEVEYEPDESNPEADNQLDKAIETVKGSN